MTFWELIRVLARYWPIVIVGGLCTAGIGLAAISDEGVYFTRTNVFFHAPTSNVNPNPVRTQSESIIDTAGLVAKRVSGPGKVTKFASPEVTLLGLGVRDGWSLRLPDTGGQWASNFTTQGLVLDIVGPSPEVVKDRQKALIQRAQQELYQLQRDAGVDPVNDITAIPAPDSTVIFHVQGNRLRALVMTAVLGVGVTISVVLAVDRRRRRREAVVTPEAVANSTVVVH